MPFRVYDKLTQNWVREECYINKLGDLLTSEKKMFGNEKLSLMSDTRYVWHKDIGYNDKNGRLIYEGDVCKIKTVDEEKVCVVSYIPSFAAYMLVGKHDDDVILYQFYEEAHELIEVIGNCFDNDYDELAGIEKKQEEVDENEASEG